MNGDRQVVSGGSRGGARGVGGKGMAEGREVGWASNIEPGPLLN